MGFRSVPVGRSGGCVFADGRSWRKGAEGGAGAGEELNYYDHPRDLASRMASSFPAAAARSVSSRVG